MKILEMPWLVHYLILIVIIINTGEAGNLASFTFGKVDNLSFYPITRSALDSQYDVTRRKCLTLFEVLNNAMMMMMRRANEKLNVIFKSRNLIGKNSSSNMTQYYDTLGINHLNSSRGRTKIHTVNTEASAYYDLYSTQTRQELPTRVHAHISSYIESLKTKNRKMVKRAAQNNKSSQDKIKDFKEGERHFQQLFLHLISKYGKEKLLNMIENKNFNHDSMTHGNLWMDYVKFFDLNKIDNIENVVKEQSKVLHMFEDLNSLERKQVMAVKKHFGLLSTEMKRSLRFHGKSGPLNSKFKRHSTWYDDFKTLYEDALGGMAPRINKRHPHRRFRKLRSKQKHRSTITDKFKKGTDLHQAGLPQIARRNHAYNNSLQQEAKLAKGHLSHILKQDHNVLDVNQRSMVGGASMNGGMRKKNPKRDFMKSLKAMYEDVFGDSKDFGQ